MLTLSRKRGESIVIGDKVIEIKVVSIRGDKVRIGISAPKGMLILRSELLDQSASNGQTSTPTE